MTFQTVSPSEFDVYHVACILSQKCIQLHRFKVLRCCHRNSKQQWIKQNRSFSFSREIVWVSQARTSIYGRSVGPTSFNLVALLS